MSPDFPSVLGRKADDTPSISSSLVIFIRDLINLCFIYKTQIASFFYMDCIVTKQS